MSELLHETIAKIIDPTLGSENSWADNAADKILAIPEIAEGLALKRKFDAQRRTVEIERRAQTRTVVTPSSSF
jgi:hypothetical protein